MDHTTMSRAQLRRVILKHRGACAAISRELGVTDSLISKWLHSKGDSSRVEAACRAKAKELLKQEQHRAA